MKNSLKYPSNGQPLAAEVPVTPLTYQPEFNSAEPRRARYKLWELQSCWHCMVVGTCLSLAEVRQLGSKAGLSVTGKSDYELHQLAVESAANNKHSLTIRLQKQLEQKFALTIKQFRLAKNEDTLVELWDSGWKAGNVAGSLWALITHPQATRSIIMTVFGQVHMMSHLSGASSCVDRGRLAEQERQIDALTSDVQKLKQRYLNTSNALLDQTQLAEQEKQKSQRLQARLLEAQRLEQKTIASNSTSRAANDPRVEQLLHRVSELQNSLSAEKDTVRKQARAINELESNQQSLLKKQAAAPPPLQKTNSTAASAELKLCGQCVLYLGGKTQQRRHFQALVESCDGRFLHHDGGRETCPHRISELVSQADVVMCPTSCISHSAMQKARTLCARQDKPIIFMQRSSLSAFTQGLRDTLGQGESD